MENGRIYRVLKSAPPAVATGCGCTAAWTEGSDRVRSRRPRVRSLHGRLTRLQNLEKMRTTEEDEATPKVSQNMNTDQRHNVHSGSDDAPLEPRDKDHGG